MSNGMCRIWAEKKEGREGFTLLELSITLVIIGLLVGGVMVGQTLIETAVIRNQIGQIDKYAQAVYAFKVKYNCLPGDCAAGASFGFPTRGASIGQGDGNGVIEANLFGWGGGTYQAYGETTTFWVDLSMAKLIDGSFNTASETTAPVSDVTTSSSPSLAAYFPQAKIGGGNYVYVWSGGKGVGNTSANNGINYFGISNVSGLYIAHSPYMDSTPTIAVLLAYSIDAKIDDGYPITGKVTAQYVDFSVAPLWIGISRNNDPLTVSLSASTTTCFDNGGVGGATQNYSMSTNSGKGQNCALSFQFR